MRNRFISLIVALAAISIAMDRPVFAQAPATVAPIGRSETGLPIGVQIIGGYLDDATTIAFAGLMEHAFGGFTPPNL